MIKKISILISFLLISLAACNFLDKTYKVVFDDGIKTTTVEVAENKNISDVNIPEPSIKEGYFFLYWATVRGEFNLNTPVTSDLLLTAIYEKGVIVTFNGGSLYSEEIIIKKGTTVEEPTINPTDPYVFIDWYKDSNYTEIWDFNTIITSDTIIYAKFELSLFSVSFISIETIIDTIEVGNGELIEKPTDPIREHYLFRGWYKDIEYKEMWDFSKDIVNDNLILYAKWEEINFTVTFIVDEELISEVIVLEGNLVIEPSDPIKENYVFKGWYANSLLWNFNSPVMETLELIAVFEKTDEFKVAEDYEALELVMDEYEEDGFELIPNGAINNTTIIYEVSSNSEYVSIDYDYLNIISKPNSSIGEVSVTIKAIIRSNDVALEKEFSFKILPIEAGNYIVTFKTNSNYHIPLEIIATGNLVSKPNDPIKEHYTFTYWSLLESAVEYDFNTPVTSNITLVANYTVNSYLVIFEIDGLEVKRSSVTYNTLITSYPTETEKIGHTILGWFSGNIKWIKEESVVTNDITLTLKYEPINYIVNFNSNGGSSVNSINVLYGNTINILPKPTREDYEFIGWYQNIGLTTVFDSNTIVIENITLYAKWKEIVIESIYIETMPNKLEYLINEQFDYDGIEVFALLDDDNTILIDNSKLIFSGFDSSDVGNIMITVTYKGVSTTYEIIIISVVISNSTYTEDFENTALGGSYATGTYTGIDGVIWEYTQVMYNDDYIIDGKGILIRRASENGSFQGTFTNGINAFSFEYKRAFTGSINRTYSVDVTNKGLTTTYVIPAFLSDTVLTFSLDDLDLEGEVIIKIYATGNNGSNQAVFDNFTWTENISNNAVVSFVTNSNIVEEDIVVLKGETVVLPILERTGYDFLGWFADIECTIQFNNDDIVHSDITLYAKWEVLASYLVIVTYYGLNNEVIYTEEIARDNYASGPLGSITTINGYSFKGWFTNSGRTVAFNLNTTIINDDLLLYGKWEEVDLSYTGYYANLGLENDLTPNQLITILNQRLRDGFIAKNYGDARQILEIADRSLTDSTKVYGMYDSRLIVGEWDGSSWTREHVWPNSKLGIPRVDNGDKSQGTDLHNLRAIYQPTNASRSNRYFSDGNGQSTNHTVGSEAYYPGDNHKGDVARIFMYMAIMWKEVLRLTNDTSKLGNNTTTNYTANGAYMGLLKLLVRWHEEDPVDEFELQRNEVIYEYQKNRNPFIDHPELAVRVYGEAIPKSTKRNISRIIAHAIIENLPNIEGYYCNRKEIY